MALAVLVLEADGTRSRVNVDREVGDLVALLENRDLGLDFHGLSHLLHLGGQFPVTGKLAGVRRVLRSRVAIRAPAARQQPRRRRIQRYSARSRPYRRSAAAQCRAARAFIQWGVRDLATAAKVSVDTIFRLERGDQLKERTVEDVRATLEAAGIVFIPENGGGAGVRLRKGL
jgi:hypothetical protein